MALPRPDNTVEFERWWTDFTAEMKREFTVIERNIALCAWCEGKKKGLEHALQAVNQKRSNG